MRPESDLRRTLARIDGRGYKAYRDIGGSWEVGEHTLHVDHVQGDPFAAPSRVRLRVPPGRAELPRDLWSNPVRRLALQDLLARRLSETLTRRGGERRGSGKSGLLDIDAGRQEVLARTALVVEDDGAVEARLQVGLPAAGRRILGRQAEAVLCRVLPEAARQALHWGGRPAAGAERFVASVENQEAVRDQLGGLGLVAFVGRGALLPRESGASDRPLPEAQAVPFAPPESLTVEVSVPNAVPGEDGPTDRLVGLGVPKGVTLIVGGGYHGKSTLLRALERGVYPHVPGDGRERVVTCPDAVKIRAEDGRRVERVDVSAFIGELPYGRRTESFSSDAASGSTSQAANIVEAVEAGASVLLLDEDTSATNFMVRDARMQALVAREHEPITPFLDRVRELWETLGVSTVLVMGGSGDYFDVADTVIRMRDYLPEEATEQAREVAAALPTGRAAEVAVPLERPPGRVPVAGSFDASRGRRDVKIDARGVDEIVFGRQCIELRGVEQLVDPSQTRAVGLAVQLCVERLMDRARPLAEVLDRLEAALAEHGLEELSPYGRRGRHPGNLARPRRHEVAAALNRLRTLQIR